MVQRDGGHLLLLALALLIRLRFLTGKVSHGSPPDLKLTKKSQMLLPMLLRDWNDDEEGWLVDQADGGEEAMKE